MGRPMLLDQQQEKSLKSAMLVGRILVSALCFIATLAYAFVYTVAVLKGNPIGFLVGFSKVPFTEPAIIVLLSIASITFVGVLVVTRSFYSKVKLKASLAMAAPVLTVLISAAFMETIAIYGLVMGFMFGSDMASLTLLMLLVTILGGVLIFPREPQWRALFERSLPSPYRGA